MLPAVSQTLANILVHYTSLKGTECISFNPPGDELTGQPGFHVYCYNVSEHVTHTLPPLGWMPRPFDAAYSGDVYCNGGTAPHWFDICFVIIAQDYTALGKHQLLSEALVSFLNHQLLDDDDLAPELQGLGKVAITITPNSVIHPSVLWQSLGVPVRPALYVTVTVPIQVMNPAIAHSHTL
jgi:hypothetical protein